MIDSFPAPIVRYFDALHARVGSARDVPRLAVCFVDGTRPEANACHQNVDHWVVEHPAHAAVRGWVIISSMAGIYYFAAHSVVRTEQGDMFDITPLPQQRTPFIPHQGTEEEFAALRGPYSNVTWAPPLN